jgi:hypothetical protein
MVQLKKSNEQATNFNRIGNRRSNLTRLSQDIDAKNEKII